MKKQILKAIEETNFGIYEIEEGYTTISEDIQFNGGWLDITVKFYIDVFSNSLNPIDDDYGIEYIEATEFSIYDSLGSEIVIDLTDEEIEKAVLC